MVNDLKVIIKKRDVNFKQLTTQVNNLKKQIVEKIFDYLTKAGE